MSRWLDRNLVFLMAPVFILAAAFKSRMWYGSGQELVAVVFFALITILWIVLAGLQIIKNKKNTS